MYREFVSVILYTKASQSKVFCPKIMGLFFQAFFWVNLVNSALLLDAAEQYCSLLGLKQREKSNADLGMQRREG